MHKFTQDHTLVSFCVMLTIVLLVMSRPARVEAQGIAVNNVSSAASNTGSLSFSHTVGSGSNRLLIVGTSFTTDCCTPLDAVDCRCDIIGVTFNGRSLTEVSGLQDNGKVGEVQIRLWQLLAPPTTTANVVISASAKTAGIAAGAISLSNVNQTIPLGTFFTTRGSSGTASVSVTGVAEGEIVIDTVGVFRGNPTIGAGQTPRWMEKDPGSNVSGAGSTEPGPAGGGAVTMSWTVDNEWAMGAVAVKPSVVTAVKMRQFTAIAYGGGVFLRWHTRREVNNLGWHVYREVNGAPVKVTPGMLAGSVFMFGQDTRLTSGFSYSWWDPAGIISDRYWIEDIDLNRTHTMHGPIVPQEAEKKQFMISCSPLLSRLGRTTSYQNLITCLRPKATK